MPSKGIRGQECARPALLREAGAACGLAARAGLSEWAQQRMSPTAARTRWRTNKNRNTGKQERGHRIMNCNPRIAASSVVAWMALLAVGCASAGSREPEVTHDGLQRLRHNTMDRD